MMLTELSFLLLWLELSAPTDGDVFLIRLSLFYDDQLVPLLSVLQVGETLKGKLAEDGKLKVRKRMNEIRALVGEVADRLCSA